jgi:hypothetical protein
MRRYELSALPFFLGMLAVAGCDGGSPSGRTDAVKPSASVPVASAPAASVKTTEAPKTTRGSGDDEAAVSGPNVPTDKFRDYVAPKREPREITLTSVPVTEAPVIDGRANEAFWQTAPAITTLDYSSQRPITLRSVHVKGEIFFLVTFPEETPQETHKTWIWDAKEEVYREGPDREDVFVFKWSMSGNDVDLRLRNPEPHRADIWFWKAHRTNPAGYADDKMQAVSAKGGPAARKIHSNRHGDLYFERWGDAGKPPWEEKVLYDFKGEKVDQFAPRQPSGSRGDVRAKGVWAKGQWTIEFGRKLSTGHDDDIAFVPGSTHLFAVACYAMALDTPHASWSRPLYRTGDAFDRLLLSLGARTAR